MNVSEYDILDFLVTPCPHHFRKVGVCRVLCLLVVSCAGGKTLSQHGGTADRAADDEACADQDDAYHDVETGHQPEREPVQRRVAVILGILYFRPLAIRRIDPVVSCKHQDSVLGQYSRDIMSEASARHPRGYDVQYMSQHCRRLCVSGGWKPPLEQSSARRHLSSNTDCFSEPLQNLPLRGHFLPNCFRFLVLYTVV